MPLNKRVKYISLWLQAICYIAAGLYHFINPKAYILLIPPYIPFPVTVNNIAGIIEITLGAALILLPKYRKMVAIALILFLIAILPVHIYHLEMGGCIEGSICMPVWAAVGRIMLQGLLILWAWSIRKL